MLYLTIVIPVRNEAEHIAGVLDRLLEQNYDQDKLEIIVVDGMSEDATPHIVQEYVQKYPNIIRYFTNPKRLASPARNIGVQNARGEAVLIVDGHCIIDNEEMLRSVSEAFEHTGADCLGRPQPLEMNGCRTPQAEQSGRTPQAERLTWAIAAARRSPLGHHPDSFIYSGKAQFSPASSVAVAYRKSVFEKIGLFDENFDAAEDVEFNTRIDAAGLTCYFDPAIAVHYVPRKTLKELKYQMERYGRGRVRLWRKHPHTASWKSFAPGLFLFVIIVAVVLFPLSYIGLLKAGLTTGPSLLGMLWWFALGSFFWCVIVLYIAAVFAESIRLTFKQKRQDIVLFLPVVFFVVHFGYGWGVLREFFFPRR